MEEPAVEERETRVPLKQVALPPYDELFEFHRRGNPDYLDSRTWILYLKTLTGKNLQVSVNKCDSVANVKEYITDKEGYPPGELLLVFRGNLLPDGTTLQTHGITNEATLHLFLRMQRPALNY